MKKMIVLLAALLLLCGLACANAQEAYYICGDYEYILLEDGTAEITAYIGEERKINVPVQLDGHAVTSIGAHAFQDCRLFEISLPKGLVSIGEYAFEGSFSLFKVVIPMGVVSIGDYAFSQCDSLNEIILPSSLITIGNYAFSKGDLTELSIPESVTYIGDFAFAECAFREITLPEGLTYLGVGAFMDTWLQRVNIPYSLLSLEGNPFAGCSILSEIILPPDHPTFEIVDDVLFDKTRKTLICYYQELEVDPKEKYTVPKGILAIAPYAFYDAYLLNVIQFPDSVTTIGEYAFATSGLEEIKIPKGISSIGEYAFSESDIDSVKIAGGTLAIGDYAFYHCGALKKVQIGGEDIAIGAYAFAECMHLTNVKLSKGVTAIGDYAFAMCDSLEKISIPDSATTMGANPFRDCDRLEKIKVSRKHPALEVIDGVLFDKAEKRLICYPYGNVASSYTVPEGTLIIGEGAFYDDYEPVLYDGVPLEEVILPEGLTVIEEMAFYGCKDLRHVPFPESLTHVGDQAFYLCQLEEISIPENMVAIGDEAFAFCDFSQVHIPAALVSMGVNPFRGCTGVKEIPVADDNPALEDIDGVLFDRAEKKLISYPAGAEADEYLVPEGTLIIGDCAFSNNDYLESIVIAEGVTTIGDKAFYDTDWLMTIVVPDSVSAIGEDVDFFCNAAFVASPNSYAARCAREQSIELISDPA